MNALIDKRTTTNMTSKGQVLIPKDVREAIGLVPGRPVDVGLNDRGEAVVMPTAQRQRETPRERVARLLAALDTARATPMFRGATAEAMQDLRGNEPLP